VMAITEWANWIARHGQACGALGALIACAPFDHEAGRAPSQVTGMPSLIFARREPREGSISWRQPSAAEAFLRCRLTGPQPTVCSQYGQTVLK